MRFHCSPPDLIIGEAGKGDDSGKWTGIEPGARRSKSLVLETRYNGD